MKQCPEIAHQRPLLQSAAPPGAGGHVIQQPLLFSASASFVCFMLWCAEEKNIFHRLPLLSRALLGTQFGLA